MFDNLLLAFLHVSLQNILTFVNLVCLNFNTGNGWWIAGLKCGAITIYCPGSAGEMTGSLPQEAFLLGGAEQRAFTIFALSACSQL